MNVQDSESTRAELDLWMIRAGVRTAIFARPDTKLATASGLSKTCQVNIKSNFVSNAFWQRANTLIEKQLGVAARRCVLQNKTIESFPAAGHHFSYDCVCSVFRINVIKYVGESQSNVYHVLNY